MVVASSLFSSVVFPLPTRSVGRGSCSLMSHAMFYLYKRAMLLFQKFHCTHWMLYSTTKHVTVLYVPYGSLFNHGVTHIIIRSTIHVWNYEHLRNPVRITHGMRLFFNVEQRSASARSLFVHFSILFSSFSSRACVCCTITYIKNQTI